MIRHVAAALQTCPDYRRNKHLYSHPHKKIEHIVHLALWTLDWTGPDV